MYNFFLLLLLFWLISFKPYAQNSFEITYKIFPKDILKNKENISQQTKKLVEGGVKYAKREEYKLKTNDTLSYFYKVDKLNFKEDPLKDIYEGIAKNFSNFNEYVFFNLKDNYLVFNKRVINSNYTIKQKPLNFNWKILDEFKEILGFNAQKAEGEYKDILVGKTFKIQAWFIKDIPISTGPDLYTGLPGLIIELNLPRSILKITNINETNKIDFDLKLNENEIINENEFKKIVESLNEKINEIKN
ncbi:GLPGLI family protein [Flavobacteriaceae bacterium 14752]|uniref:GLPGLI family protein n=1 Tax=Mesohalobacter salilacus TaxID=2491711 RepID=UPI000F63DF68|nr:GLPGLI family protein [Flavobacteriaceae bacterium 14752]